MEKILDLRDDIYKKYGNSPNVTHSVGNYCSIIIRLLNLFDEKELYNRGIGKLEGLLSREIPLNDFIELHEKETGELNNLFKKYDISKKEDKEKIISDFKNFIS